MNAIILCSLPGFGACDQKAQDPASDAVLELTHSEAGASGSLEFTRIRDLLVDSEGLIYVLDGPSTIPVLSPSGDLVRTIGRPGAGPGEFRGISSAFLGSADTLFLYDIELARLTAFSRGSDRPASVTYLREEHPLFPAFVKNASAGTVYAIYRRFYGDGSGREEGKPSMDLVRQLGRNGEVSGDSLLLLREQQSLEVSEGTSHSVMRNPFGRRTVLRVASDGRIFTAWTDSARFEVHSPEGELLRTIEARDPPGTRPVTAAERDSLIAAYSPDGQRAPAIRRALDRLNHRTWPLVQDFILDDRDRIWYAAVPQRGDTINTWVALDTRGNAVERLTLPVNATPHVIRGARAYVSETDSLDVPRVVIYDLQPAPARRDE